MPSKIVLAFLCVCAWLWAGAAQAQSNDPADYFLNAYTAYQKGEKLESQGNLQGALQAFQEASQMISTITSRWPTWNRTIVDFRGNRIAEAIARVQKKLAATGHLEGGVGIPEISAGPAEVEPPPSLDPNEPTLPRDPERPKAGRGLPKVAAGGNPVQAMNEAFTQLQQELQKSKSELDEAQSAGAKLKRELEEARQAKAAAEEKTRTYNQRAELAEKALTEERKQATQNAEKVALLQAQYQKARKDVDDLKLENEARSEVDRQNQARLARAYDRAKTALDAGDAALKDKKKADLTVAEIQKKSDAAVEAARKRVDEVIKQRDELSAKLTVVIQERDAARGELVKLKEAQKQVDKLVNDNTRLMAQLSDAEKQIKQFRADGEQKDTMIAGLKKEVTSVKQQLTDAQKQSATYLSQMTELQARLDTSSKEISQMKTANAATVAEKKKMQDENEILRGIVMRQMKEDARRSITNKVVQEQIGKLAIKSTELLKQINYLGQPVVQLTKKERELFKKPQVEIGDINEINRVASQAPVEPPAAGEIAPAPEAVTPPATSEVASIVPPTPAPITETPVAPVPTPMPEKAVDKPVEKPAPAATPDPAKPSAKNASKEAPKASAPLSLELPMADALAPLPETAPATSATVGPGVSAAMSENIKAAPGIPTELLPLVQQGKDEFEKGNYREAEKTYEKILQKAPTNLYALSNLGVVRYRSGKLKLAEEAFKKAIAIAPEDGFSHCTLGIVFYVENKYDDAVNSLTKALAINPKNATAHNYLGITASQKGWQDAAQKELETATALDPAYADAWFNLAVIFATKNPPDKENARRCYKKAVELGAEADSSLEGLIK